MQFVQNPGHKAIGLDIGTSRIVLAEPNGSGFHYRAQLNSFISLPYSKVTEAMLRKEEIPCKVMNNCILVLGERAQKLAHTLNVDVRRPMSRGLLNPREPQGVPVIEEMVLRLAGHAQQGERVCLSVPGAGPGTADDLAYHRTTLAELLESLGFQVSVINEGLAVVFAELSETNFTGLGISFGGGTCNVCLACLGLPVITFSTAKAGDFVDDSAAGVTAETPTTIRLIKEQSLVLNGRGSTEIDRALSVYYDEMIGSVVQGLSEALSGTRKLAQIDRPVPVAISGGSARPGGFLPRVEKALRAADLPIQISEIRLAQQPLDTTAKGALMAALLEA
jgi:hypothetical protein